MCLFNLLYFRRGRATANYLIQNYEHLFHHDWSSDSIDKWIDLEDEEVPIISLEKKNKSEIELTEASEQMDPIERFKMFLEEKKVRLSCNFKAI